MKKLKKNIGEFVCLPLLSFSRDGFYSYVRLCVCVCVCVCCTLVCEMVLCDYFFQQEIANLAPNIIHQYLAI
jgi:hypothetical protein